MTIFNVANRINFCMILAILCLGGEILRQKNARENSFQTLSPIHDRFIRIDHWPRPFASTEGKQHQSEVKVAAPTFLKDWKSLPENLGK